LPAPQTVVTPNAAVTATAWSDFPSTATISVTVAHKMLVKVSLAAWVQASANTNGDVRVTVASTGATAIGYYNTSWGEVLYMVGG
jgi:hypothetical protein